MQLELNSEASDNAEEQCVACARHVWQQNCQSFSNICSYVDTGYRNLVQKFITPFQVRVMNIQFSFTIVQNSTIFFAYICIC